MIELPLAHGNYTRAAMSLLGRNYVDIGHVQTIDGISKRWSGIEWTDVDLSSILPEFTGPVKGDFSTNTLDQTTVFDGTHWLIVDDGPRCDHFSVEDTDLNALLNLAGDLVLGNANMDTGIMFGRILERIESRLGVAN